MIFISIVVGMILGMLITRFCLRRHWRLSGWAYVYAVTFLPLALIIGLTALFAALHKWASYTLETLFDLCTVKIG